MSIQIWNTLTNQKEELRPLEPGKISMYVCGVTVYDMCHVGHARAYVTADVINRWLCASDLKVTYARNFTDVDDKIINRARETGVDPRALADRFIAEFYTDMDALGIRRPDLEPRVTDHIPDIIGTVQCLIDRGHAYVLGGDVYFEVKTFGMYGRLSRCQLDDIQCGARVEVDERKRHPADFALWKSSKPGEPAWDSPWGPGRPGWHIECSTMSTKYLGDTLDIHGGGRDLIFPHHENEIAQSEAATGKPFARVFFHNGFVNIDREKMSKSLNNFFTIREMIERHHAEALRYFLLGTHYRSPINFEVQFTCPACERAIGRPDIEARRCPACKAPMDDGQARRAIQFPSLAEAERRVDYLYATKQRIDDFLKHSPTGSGELLRSGEIEALLPRFQAGMDDDFNTPQGLAVLAEALKVANEVMDNKERKPKPQVTSTVHRIQSVLEVIADALGLLERDAAEVLADLQARALRIRGLEASAIEAKVLERTAARRARDFAQADALRQELTLLGVELQDTPQGTTWKVKL